ncbi:unnamed protein product, partial [Brassica rapa subsp. narinosa]
MEGGIRGWCSCLLRAYSLSKWFSMAIYPCLEGLSYRSISSRGAVRAFVGKTLAYGAMI